MIFEWKSIKYRNILCDLTAGRCHCMNNFADDRVYLIFNWVNVNDNFAPSLFNNTKMIRRAVNVARLPMAKVMLKFPLRKSYPVYEMLINGMAIAGWKSATEMCVSFSPKEWNAISIWFCECSRRNREKKKAFVTSTACFISLRFKHSDKVHTQLKNHHAWYIFHANVCDCTVKKYGKCATTKLRSIGRNKMKDGTEMKVNALWKCLDKNACPWRSPWKLNNTFRMIGVKPGCHKFQQLEYPNTNHIGYKEKTAPENVSFGFIALTLFILALLVRYLYYSIEVPIAISNVNTEHTLKRTFCTIPLLRSNSVHILKGIFSEHVTFQ